MVQGTSTKHREDEVKELKKQVGYIKVKKNKSLNLIRHSWRLCGDKT